MRVLAAQGDGADAADPLQHRDEMAGNGSLGDDEEDGLVGEGGVLHDGLPNADAFVGDEMGDAREDAGLVRVACNDFENAAVEGGRDILEVKRRGEATEGALKLRVLADGLHGSPHDAAVDVRGSAHGGVGNLNFAGKHLAVVDAQTVLNHEPHDALLGGVAPEVVNQDLPHEYYDEQIRALMVVEPAIVKEVFPYGRKPCRSARRKPSEDEKSRARRRPPGTIANRETERAAAFERPRPPHKRAMKQSNVAEAVTGRSLRMGRLTRSGVMLMVPLDHGISMGPLPGLADPAPVLAAAARGGATCTTLHKGLVRYAAPHADKLGILLHLSASTDAAPDPNDKRLVATVEEALRLGCDGVSLHVNVGSLTEARQLEEAGRVGAACAEWGMPLVAMMYPRGPQVRDPSDPGLVAHAARLAAELGADAVKVPYTGSESSFRTVVAGAGIPVIVAGGPSRDATAMLTDLRHARRAGAAGASIGRNVFQSPDPVAALSAIAAVWRE